MKLRAKLTAKFVDSVCRPGKYYDGQGLHLRVYPGGAKCWEQRITFGGRRRTLGLGGYPVVTLKMARDGALENRRVVAAGDDPVALKRRPGVPTFAEAARIVCGNHRAGWTNARSAKIWMSSLERHVLPRFGARLVSDIGPRDVLDVLLPIWTEKPDMARRVRQRLSTVMKWAVASGYRSDNPGGDAIAGALPRSKKTQEHHRAVPHAEVGEVIGKVRESTGHLCTRLAFEFLVLTAARSGEVRRAVWEEMDVASRMWTVPAERMKAREVHRVALSGAALAVLEQARELGVVQGLVFPSKLGRAISDATMSKLLRDLGIPGVPHGFRSSFRDWCGDTRVPREVAEACLAHTVGNRVEAAYARSDLFELRRPVMEDWAEYVRPTSSGAAPTPPSGTGPRREPPRAARGTRGRRRLRSGARREVELPQLALFVPGGESGDD